MILSNTINQRYRYATQGKTLTQIQQELRELGVKGFVVKVNEIKRRINYDK